MGATSGPTARRTCEVRRALRLDEAGPRTHHCGDSTADVLAGRADPPEGGVPQQPTILVVDDTPLNDKLLTGVLTPQGYRIVSAGSGPEALAAVASDAPDLILLDLVLPGMDGTGAGAMDEALSRWS